MSDVVPSLLAFAQVRRNSPGVRSVTVRKCCGETMLAEATTMMLIPLLVLGALVILLIVRSRRTRTASTASRRPTAVTPGHQ